LPRGKEIVQDLPVYTRDELLANSVALFGVRPEVVAGALCGSDKKEFTVQDLQKIIDQFLNRRVC